jgi:hypothetical protein
MMPSRLSGWNRFQPEGLSALGLVEEFGISGYLSGGRAERPQLEISKNRDDGVRLTVFVLLDAFFCNLAILG